MKVQNWNVCKEYKYLREEECEKIKTSVFIQTSGKKITEKEGERNESTKLEHMWSINIRERENVKRKKQMNLFRHLGKRITEKEGEKNESTKLEHM